MSKEKSKEDIMIVPEKETFFGFERPANSHDNPFWWIGLFNKENNYYTTTSKDEESPDGSKPKPN